MTTLLSHKTIKSTRKPCQCFGCGREMPAGSKIVRVICAEGRDLYTCNWCEVCRRYTEDWDMGDFDCCGFGDCHGQGGWEAIRAELEDQFYIVDLRKEWRRQKYVTFWRPTNSGYAWPIEWAGIYDKTTVDTKRSYYYSTDGRSKERFPVAYHVVRAMAASPPDSGDVDGNVGLVIRNTEANRRKLRAAAYEPPAITKTPEFTAE